VGKHEQKPSFTAPPVAKSEPPQASAAPQTREPIDALFAKIDQALAMPRWKRTAAAGGNGGGAFEDRPKSPRLLVGFQVTTAPLGGNSTIKSLRPIYRTPGGVVHGNMHGHPVGGQIEVVARKGYAVGGFFAKSGHRVDGFKLVFMRIAADGLDSSDAYQSAWIGGQGGGAVVEFTAKGKPVVGIFGRQGVDLDSVGLVLLAE
jgi:hypothetical protein